MSGTLEDKVYAAGFFDGEGSVTITRQEAKYGPLHHLVVTASQKHLKVIEWFRNIWEGYICIRRPGDVQLYDWRITTNGAARFLADIAPYTKIKSNQAALGLEFTELVHSRPNLQLKLTDDERAIREAYKQEIMRLNRRREV